MVLKSLTYYRENYGSIGPRILGESSTENLRQVEERMRHVSQESCHVAWTGHSELSFFHLLLSYRYTDWILVEGLFLSTVPAR